MSIITSKTYKNFKDISYLKIGNKKRSYEILTKINIFTILSKYKPILVGTIPIEIDIEKSDLDIICKVYDFKSFREILISNFESYENFKITYNEDNTAMICNFNVEEMEVEIYSTKEDTYKLASYRHMIIEDRLLNLGGKKLKYNVIKLKKRGLKTEPAFAKILNLEGNPYEQLLLLEEYNDKELIGLLNKTLNLK